MIVNQQLMNCLVTHSEQLTTRLTKVNQDVRTTIANIRRF
jgi:hypothetical protein